MSPASALDAIRAIADDLRARGDRERSMGNEASRAGRKSRAFMDYAAADLYHAEAAGLERAARILDGAIGWQVAA